MLVKLSLKAVCQTKTVLLEISSVQNPGAAGKVAIAASRADQGSIHFVVKYPPWPRLEPEQRLQRWQFVYPSPVILLVLLPFTFHVFFRSCSVELKDAGMHRARGGA